MANTLKTMLQIRRIIQLLEQNKSPYQIGKELNFSKNTVKAYNKKLKASGLSYEQLQQLDDSTLELIIFPSTTPVGKSTKFAHLHKLIPEYIKRLNNSHITRELLWIEYKQSYPDGYSYTQFCEYIQRHLKKTNAVMHLEHKPADVLQIDFAGDKLTYVDITTGEIIPCPILVFTMPYSNLIYLEALPNQTQENMIASISRCLEYLGGVPRNIKSDNLKQVVKKANRYEPELSEMIDQFSLHYNTSFTAARVVKPRDKASVERHVGIAYTQIYSIIEQKIYHSIEELNIAIFELMEKLNNKPMQKKEHSRSQLFEQMEKPLLLALPTSAFIIKHKVQAKVTRSYHVILGEDWHNYSVPYEYIGKKVIILYDHQNIEIYYNLKRIAIHKRNIRKHGYSTEVSHMPPNHQAVKQTNGYTVEYFIQKAHEIGVNTAKVIEQITGSKYFSQQTFNSCLGILRLKNNYTAERLERACQIALIGSKINYHTINNILKNNMDKQQKEEEIIPVTTKEHGNIRGKEIYSGLFKQIIINFN